VADSEGPCQNGARGRDCEKHRGADAARGFVGAAGLRALNATSARAEAEEVAFLLSWGGCRAAAFWKSKSFAGPPGG
jgi:hypothetical protein